MRLAIIADPHLHDTTFDPRVDGSGSYRTLAETVASTRVFNESVTAFRARSTTSWAAGSRMWCFWGT